jgi:uncharacterized protein YecE (DUF72 family)
MGRVRVGVSGWRYPGWRGDFYPPGLRQRDELAFAAARLDTIEVNGSFYALQRPASYAAWRAAAPPGFVFAVKGSRYITHLRRLEDVETPLANFLASGVLALGPMLGPLLWQLPARQPFDPGRLDRFLALLPRTTAEAAELAARHDAKVPDDRALTVAENDQPLRHALEPRHAGFAAPAARALVARHGVALVVSDSAGRWPVMDDTGAPFHYVRLHGEGELYAGGYAEDSLDRWARRCREWSASADVYVYFDNDARGRAPHDAVALRERLAADG